MVIFKKASCFGKAELSRWRDHAEAAVCEGLLLPDDSAGIDTQYSICTATALPFPGFGQAAARVLAQYQMCIPKGAWARLVFETCSGNERIDFSCTKLQQVCMQGSKRPANVWRQE
jgi:hypothetical protein